MTTPRSSLARVALISNGMVQFGLSLLFVSIAAEQTYAAFTGQWFSIFG